VPTVTFQHPFCFVMMFLDRRRIVHVNVTRHLTAEWAAQQIVEAFPGDGWMPRFLQRERDGVFGWAFRRRVKALGITELISGARSPWQNAYVERLIGSIRGSARTTSSPSARSTCCERSASTRRTTTSRGPTARSTGTRRRRAR
jgi:hypothetical protein